MYNANTLAHVILAHARRLGQRSLSAIDRQTLATLLPRLSGVVYVMAWHALRYYSVEVA